MAVTIDGRLSRPGDWKRVELGEFHVQHYVAGDRGPILVTTVAFGNSQCVICGEPIQAEEGEIEKCHHCWHSLERYKQGRKLSKKWEDAIKEYLQGAR